MDKELNASNEKNIADRKKRSDIVLIGIKALIVIISVIAAGAACFYLFSLENTYTLKGSASLNIISDIKSKVGKILTGNFDEERKPDEKVSLLSFGDVMLDREVRLRISRGGDPFSEIRRADENFFRGMDLVSINLEGPVTNNPNCPKGELLFQFDSATAIKFLKENNINLANLANNHTSNCGKNGISDTEKYLGDSGIGYFGSTDKRYIVKQVGEVKIAFVGINALAESGRLPEFYDSIKKIKTENDYVVINIHWGSEYSRSFSGTQQKIAHSLIDNGADMIIGHHPHVVQPLEVYKNKPIFYSLGNFVFDQVLPDTKKGIGVGAVFSKEKISLSVIPFDIKNYFQPILMDNDKTKTFCDEFLNGFTQSDVCKIEIVQKQE